MQVVRQFENLNLTLVIECMSIMNDQIFISYSHKDEEWKDRLLPHLRMLEKADLGITVWDDRKIDIGDKWYPEIEEAMRKAAFAICLISANYLSSDFIVKEKVPFLLERHKKEGMFIFPILISPCVWRIFSWISETQMLPRDRKSIEEDYPEKYNGIFKQIPEKMLEIINTPDYEVPAPTAKWAQPEKEDISRLPKTEYELFGRKKELELLEEAWQSDQTNIISFVAWGGVGKSTLINKWVERMQADNFRDAKKVFAWSFYSQGTNELVTSADLFINEALIWFEDENPAEGSPWEKGKRLAKLLRQDKTLLLLDGLEPLQSSFDFEKGKIKDAALSVLVSELAKENNGLCVITTREEVPEILHYPSSVSQLSLDPISDEAGRALLRVRGIQGTDAELEGVTRSFGKHALAINLLAEYLRGIKGHPAQKAHDIPDLDISDEKGRHPRRVMEAFAARFGEGSELELLRIFGLFNRPADKAAIDAVVKDEPIPGLTEYLHKLSEGEWLGLLQKLRRAKLIAPESHHRPDTLDCHPLIREHFGEKLLTDNPKAWKEANSRLYEYFKNLPEKELPETLEEMEPLFMAVNYGCQARHYREALDDVYWKRILRKQEFFSYTRLSAFGADLAALSGFTLKLWELPVKELALSDQSFVMAAVALCLRRLGKLDKAIAAMDASLRFASKESKWQKSEKLASDLGPPEVAGDLGQIYCVQGHFAKAIKYAKDATELAGMAENKDILVGALTKLAIFKYYSGKQKEALSLFQRAEKLQKENKPEYPLLESTRGFRYCEFLLDQGRYKEVIRRAHKTLEWADKKKYPLACARDILTLGKAYLLEAMEDKTQDFGVAERRLDQAIESLRKTKDQDSIARGLLACTVLFRVLNDLSKAWSHLEEVREIAELGSMRLHLADYHLEACRLSLAQTKPEKASQHFQKAKAMIDEIGYHRRDSDLEKLSAEMERI